MAKFTLNAQRFDPYKNFKFRINWEGSNYTGGGGEQDQRLNRTTEVVEYREGATPAPGRKSPGRTKYEAITLERGVTHDTEFEVGEQGVELRLRASAPRCRCGTSARNVVVELYNEAGQLANAYKVYRCWVSEYQALPELDASANAVAIQTHQARARRLGARQRGARAERAQVQEPAVARRDARRAQRSSQCGSGAPPGGPPPPAATLRAAESARPETLRALPTGERNRACSRCAGDLRQRFPRRTRALHGVVASACSSILGATWGDVVAGDATPRRAHRMQCGRRHLHSPSGFHVTCQTFGVPCRARDTVDAQGVIPQVLCRRSASIGCDPVAVDALSPAALARDRRCSRSPLDPDANIRLAASTVRPASYSSELRIRHHRVPLGGDRITRPPLCCARCIGLARGYGWP